MSLTAGIDFYCFTVMSTNDPDVIISQYLDLNPADFVDRGYGVKGYRECRYYDDIRVFYNGREGVEHENGHGTEFMGVYACLSGDALRQYARLGKRVLDLLERTSGDKNVHITRIDLNADDRGGILDMDKMIAYCDNHQIRSRTRKRELVRSRNGQVAPANTLYIGSRSSDIYTRIYDKAKEQYDPYRQPDEYNAHWVRVELQLRRERATNAVAYILQELARGGALGECYAHIINGFMTFIERTDSNISRCPVAEWWTDFLETIKAVKLFTTEKVVHKFERKMVWFYENIAPMASALLEGVGELPLLRMLAVAKKHRKSEYDKMVRVYLRDTAPTPIQDILGFEFKRENKRWYTSNAYRERWEGERSGETFLSERRVTVPVEDNREWWQISYGREYNQTALYTPC